jgi:ubiquinone/menaquinone biosynthesis C-methylase UbiE
MTYDEQSDFAEKKKFLYDLFEMLQPYERDTRSWRTLEVGGEGGMLAGLMASHVGHLIGTDIINSQFAYQGELLTLLRDKFRRNGEELPLDKLEFLMADAQNLPFRDDWFDFCFSQNAFEHIPDPELALREMVRVTRPGGLIYLMFDPVWTADSGSHFLHFIGQPWAHLLESDSAIAQRMADSGASNFEIESYQSHMNRRPVTYYREMFTRVTQELGVKILIRHEWSGCVDPAFVDHPNLVAAAAAHGLSTDDLLVRGLRFLLEV